LNQEDGQEVAVGAGAAGWVLGPSDLLGAWTVARTIEDRLTGGPSRFDGRATFTPQGDGLRYSEAGTLRLGEGASFAASRSYLWRWDGGCVEVRFSDGRPFHRFRPSGVGAGIDHPCGADLYRVAYDFTAWPAWEAAWTVTGPAKDYRMRAAYARAQGTCATPSHAPQTGRQGTTGGPRWPET